MITLKLTDKKNKTYTFTDETVDICFWNFLEKHSSILDDIVFVDYTDNGWDRDMVTNEPYWSNFHSVAFRKKYKITESAFKSGMSFYRYLKGDAHVQQK